MKKVLLLSIFLLNLLSIITNNSIGSLQIKAQSMGSEVTYYPCKEWDTQKMDYDWHFSTSPCDNNLPGVCVTVCKYCHNSMSCENAAYHTCPGMYQDEHGYEPQYPQYPPQPTTPTNGGTPTIGGVTGCGGVTVDPNPDDGKRHGSRSSDNYDPKLSKSYGHNIYDSDFTKDILRIQMNASTITQNNSTCSAAVIEKALAELSPDRLKKLAFDLYMNGESTIGNTILPECMADYKANYLVSHTAFNKNHQVVDLLVQTGLTNAMNGNNDKYDPADDDGGLFSHGWQGPTTVENMLKKLFPGRVSSQALPSVEDVSKINLKNYFVIFLCRPNPNEKIFDLDGNILNQHYAQLIDFDKDKTTYWSWGDKHESYKTNRFEYIILINK